MIYTYKNSLCVQIERYCVLYKICNDASKSTNCYSTGFVNSFPPELVSYVSSHAGQHRDSINSPHALSAPMSTERLYFIKRVPRN